MALKYKYLLLGTSLFIISLLSVPDTAHEENWSVDASLVEDCSCREFCPCYFQHLPDRGGMCDFNTIFNVNSSNYGDVKIDGVRVWLAGNLEGDGSAFQGKWLTLAFDEKTTKEQEDATIKVLSKIYPLEWNVLPVEKKPITLLRDGDVIDASMPGAHLRMTANKGADGKSPVVLNNLQ